MAAKLTLLRCLSCGEPPQASVVIETEAAALYATIALAKWLRTVVRRAEVDGLVADERHETLRHDYHCNNRRTGCGCRGDRAQSALDRLAQLAMEGHGDG